MSYKAGIVEAIQELGDRTGSSTIAIKKVMQAKLPKDKKWQNATFLSALKAGVEKGELVKNKNSYKISAEYKKKLKSSKPAVAKTTKPKSKAVAAKKSAKKTVKKATKAKAPKKSAQKTTTASKKKVVKKAPVRPRLHSSLIRICVLN